MKKIVIDKIIEVINDNIENLHISVEKCDEDLIKLGMDSIKFIRIIVSLEAVFECEIPDSKLLITEMNTINKIYDTLNSALADSI